MATARTSSAQSEQDPGFTHRESFSEFYDTPWSERYKNDHGLTELSFRPSQKQEIINAVSMYAASLYGERYGELGPEYSKPQVSEVPKEDEAWLKPFWDSLSVRSVSPSNALFEVYDSINSRFEYPEGQKQILQTYYGAKYREEHQIPTPSISGAALQERYPAKDGYTEELNNRFLQALFNKTGFWMHDDPNPSYCKNPFTNKVYQDENQLLMQLSNKEGGTNYINYAPLQEVMHNRPGWIQSMRNHLGLATVAYLGKNNKGEKQYILTMPTKAMKQNVIQEDPATQLPVNNVHPINLNPTDKKNLETFFTQQLAQYMNCAFTKRSYMVSAEWSDRDINAFSEMVQKDQDLISRSSQNAFRMATERIRQQEQTTIHSEDDISHSAKKQRTKDNSYSR